MLFIVVYTAATSMSLPGRAVLSITGGLLGGALVVIGATIGATGIFLIAKTALGDSLRQRAGAWLKKMEEGFRENALSYLLTLRLIPLFPYFVANLVPALLGVRLRVYVLGTAIGIIPGALVFTFAGAGIGAVRRKERYAFDRTHCQPAPRAFVGPNQHRERPPATPAGHGPQAAHPLHWQTSNSWV